MPRRIPSAGCLGGLRGTWGLALGSGGVEQAWKLPHGFESRARRGGSRRKRQKGVSTQGWHAGMVY